MTKLYMVKSGEYDDLGRSVLDILICTAFFQINSEMTESEQEGLAPAFVSDVAIPSMPITCSPAEAWDDIDRAKKAPKNDKPQVVPLVRVINGVVQNVAMQVIPPAKLLRNKNLFRLEMKTVFPNAAAEVMTFYEDFSEFNFREGSLSSDWVAASKLRLKFWKTYGDDGENRLELTSAERNALEAKDFVIRIVLTPEKDPSKIAINWTALPIDEANFKSITDHKTAKNGE